MIASCHCPQPLWLLCVAYGFMPLPSATVITVCGLRVHAVCRWDCGVWPAGSCHCPQPLWLLCVAYWFMPLPWAADIAVITACGRLVDAVSVPLCRRRSCSWESRRRSCYRRSWSAPTWGRAAVWWPAPATASQTRSKTSQRTRWESPLPASVWPHPLPASVWQRPLAASVWQRPLPASVWQRPLPASVWQRALPASV